VGECHKSGVDPGWGVDPPPFAGLFVPSAEGFVGGGDDNEDFLCDENNDWVVCRNSRENKQ